MHPAATPPTARPHTWRFLAPRDIFLFIRSARSDAKLTAFLQNGTNPAAAFDQLYDEAPQNDPWASASPLYRYQSGKYDGIVALLPEGRRFRNALDLGCGTGLLASRLAQHSETTLGLDISRVAITQARARTPQPGLSYAQADLLQLDPALNHRFDLVVVADALYYLPPEALTDTALKTLATRLATLLAPDGILMLANHYFSGMDADSRKSRRIHNAFIWSPALAHTTTHRRPFWLATLLSKAP